MARSLLSQRDGRLLLETRDLLEELLETEEVLRDKRLLKSIRESQRNLRSGRIYTSKELKRKLDEL